MKTSRHLFVTLPLLTAAALAQSPVATAVSIIPGPVTVAPVAATLAPAVTAVSVNTGVVVPATPAPTVIATPVNTVVPINTTVPANTLVPVPIAVVPNEGETAVTLDVGFGIRAVPPSRVSVPVGETLRVTAPPVGEDITYIWTRNDRAIPGATSNVLTLSHVTTEDAGTYVCRYSTPTTMPGTSQALVLGVGQTERLINLSTRSVISAASPTLVSGFVVSGARDKKLIVRAVGPSLAQFGEANPLRAPALKIYNSAGQPYENAYVYPAVVGGLTYETDLAQSLAKTGAFPLAEGTRDVTQMKPFAPGTYTVEVSSADGGSGPVLLEIYEVQ